MNIDNSCNNNTTIFTQDCIFKLRAGAKLKKISFGLECLASAIGNGGLADIGIVGSEGLIDKRMERDTLLRRVMEPYPLRINRNRLDTLYSLTRPDTTAELTYFFHPDHLGSASWITDMSGQPVQHLQYMPFGGDYLDQQDPNTDYSERFRFTGKERDAETGYDYFGARYYSSSLGIWLSVDPMSDKYPSLSPYVYCADNPMRLVDLKGETIWIIGDDDTETKYSKDMSAENMSGFTAQAIVALNQISATDIGGLMIQELMDSKNDYCIEKSDASCFYSEYAQRFAGFAKQWEQAENKNGYNYYKSKGEVFEGGAGGKIYWDPNGTELPTTKGDMKNPVSDLGHELFHGWDACRGLLNNDDYNGISRNEWQASYNENILRQQMGLPLRTHYGEYYDPSGKFLGYKASLLENNNIIKPYWYNY